MTGFVVVDAQVVASDEELERWIATAHAYVASLASKERHSWEAPNPGIETF